MTPRCVNCIHWDEEEANEEGLAPCRHPRDCDSDNPMLVGGDDVCSMHEPILATVGTCKPL